MTGWGVGYQAGAAPLPGYRNDPRSKLDARFRELVAAGLIDPNNITGPDGRIKPEVWQQLQGAGGGNAPSGMYGDMTRPPGYANIAPVTAVPGAQPAGYRGPVGEPGAQPNYEVWNPAELNHDEWLQGHIALLEQRQAERSGSYLDPITGQQTVTATQGAALLDRFGNAQTAQQQYRDRIAQQNAQQQQNVAGAYQNVLQAGEAAARAGQGVIPGRGTAADEAAAAAANRAVYGAQTAYNRARSVGPRPDQPITPAQLGAGMTSEQFSQLAQATAQGYTPEELEDIQKNPQKYARQMRYKPALAYREANLARGGL